MNQQYDYNEKERNTHDTTEFQFPDPAELQQQLLQITMLQELKDCLSKLTIARFGVCLEQMYKLSNRIHKDGVFSYVMFSCRHCCSKFSIRHNGRHLEICKQILKHVHKPKIIKIGLESAVTNYIRENYKPSMSIQDQLMQKAMREFRVSEQMFRRLAKRFLVSEANSFPFLQEMLQSEGYKVAYEWGSQREELYPVAFVVVSPTMIKNYQLFGDLVSFDITYNLLKNQNAQGRLYRIGAFCVMDSNIRLLIVGIAVLCRETATELFSVFEMFVRLHTRAPQTFITDEQGTMTSAIEELRHRQLFSGAHIINPWHALKNFRRQLTGTPQEINNIMKNFDVLVYTRSRHEYHEAAFALNQIKPHNKAVIEKFFEKAQRLCFLDIERTYIGIKRFSAQGINDLIKAQIPQETTILDFFRKVRVLDEILARKSQKGYHIYSEPIEDLFKDDRLHEVRHRVEKKPFNQLIENYIKCREEIQILGEATDERTQSVTFQVEDKKEKYLYEIRDWSCSCDQLEKTGIPCPHLLFCAKQKSQKKLLELFNLRWIREIPQRSKKTNIQWIKPGPASTSRRNTYRRRRRV